MAIDWNKQHLRVTMPDLTKWDVPVMAIIQHRAEHYSGGDALKRTKEYFTASDGEPDLDEISDWAENNMNWEEVASVAKRAEEDEDEPDYEDGWINGPKEIVTL